MNTITQNTHMHRIIITKLPRTINGAFQSVEHELALSKDPRQQLKSYFNKKISIPSIYGIRYLPFNDVTRLNIAETTIIGVFFS